MKKILLLILFVGSSLSSLAQNGNIEMRKSFWGTKFTSDGKVLTPKEVLTILESNPQAHAEFKKAKANLGVSNVLGFVGGFMIGWPVGTAIGGGDPQWGIAGAGAGLVIVAIPFSSGFNKRARKALDIYNGKTPTSSINKPSLSLSAYGAGVRLKISF